MTNLAATVVADAAAEGLNVIRGMLIVGGVFLAMIAVGEFARWVRHRREHQ